MLRPQIRIIKSDPKWTNFIYITSNARSRMSTSDVNLKMSKNEIEVINPEVLFTSGATQDISVQQGTLV